MRNVVLDIISKATVVPGSIIIIIMLEAMASN
jgi:hypothetical protein